MIRPVTVLCFLLACGSGLYLYQCKHRSQLLDREIAHTVRQAEQARERAGMLRAEYTLLNDPSRLSELAGKHLASLKTTAPTQFTNWTELDRRLPAVPPPPVEAAAPETEAPVGQPAEMPVAQAPVANMPVARMPEPKAEPQVASRPAQAPTPPAPQRAAASTVVASLGGAAQAAVPPAPRQMAPRFLAAPPRPATPPVSLTASLSPTPAPRPAPRPAPPPANRPASFSAPAPVLRPAVPAPQPASVLRAATPQQAAQFEAPERIARASVVSAPVAPSAPVSVSALGMARTMAPTAVSSANAAPYWQTGGGQPAGVR